MASPAGLRARSNTATTSRRAPARSFKGSDHRRETKAAPERGGVDLQPRAVPAHSERPVTQAPAAVRPPRVRQGMVAPGFLAAGSGVLVATTLPSWVLPVGLVVGVLALAGAAYKLGQRSPQENRGQQSGSTSTALVHHKGSGTQLAVRARHEVRAAVGVDEVEADWEEVSPRPAVPVVREIVPHEFTALARPGARTETRDLRNAKLVSRDGQVFCDINFSEMGDLAGLDLSDVILVNCSFRGCDLRGVIPPQLRPVTLADVQRGEVSVGLDASGAILNDAWLNAFYEGLPQPGVANFNDYLPPMTISGADLRHMRSLEVFIGHETEAGFRTHDLRWLEHANNDVVQFQDMRGMLGADYLRYARNLFRNLGVGSESGGTITSGENWTQTVMARGTPQELTVTVAVRSDGLAIWHARGADALQFRARLMDQEQAGMAAAPRVQMPDDFSRFFFSYEDRRGVTHRLRMIRWFLEMTLARRGRNFAQADFAGLDVARMDLTYEQIVFLDSHDVRFDDNQKRTYLAGLGQSDTPALRSGFTGLNIGGLDNLTGAQIKALDQAGAVISNKQKIKYLAALVPTDTPGLRSGFKGLDVGELEGLAVARIQQLDRLGAVLSEAQKKKYLESLTPDQMPDLKNNSFKGFDCRGMTALPIGHVVYLVEAGANASSEQKLTWLRQLLSTYLGAEDSELQAEIDRRSKNVDLAGLDASGIKVGIKFESRGSTRSSERQTWYDRKMWLTVDILWSRGVTFAEDVYREFVEGAGQYESHHADIYKTLPKLRSRRPGKSYRGLPQIPWGPVFTVFYFDNPGLITTELFTKNQLQLYVNATLERRREGWTATNIVASPHSNPGDRYDGLDLSQLSWVDFEIFAGLRAGRSHNFPLQGVRVNPETHLLPLLQNDGKWRIGVTTGESIVLADPPHGMVVSRKDWNAHKSKFGNETEQQAFLDKFGIVIAD